MCERGKPWRRSLSLFVLFLNQAMKLKTPHHPLSKGSNAQISNKVWKNPRNPLKQRFKHRFSDNMLKQMNTYDYECVWLEDSYQRESKHTPRLCLEHCFEHFGSQTHKQSTFGNERTKTRYVGNLSKPCNTLKPCGVEWLVME